MKPLVLNAWAQTEGDQSRVCLESTYCPLEVQVLKPRRLPNGDYAVGVRLPGLGLGMAPDEILVTDGLIRKIVVHQGEQASIDIVLEHCTEPSVRTFPGMPARAEFSFSRSPLTTVFSGKTIAVDPGHGGRDAGVRGPVSLLEKNVALDIATELGKMLEACGATPLMSRDTDCDVDLAAWTLALAAARPQVLVEIHTSGEKDPMGRSYHIYARQGSEESCRVAKEIAEALTERMGITFSGIEDMEFGAIPLWPALRVEPVCLTHFVDEANFRAPLFRKRIAQAIFNGICRYLSSAGRGGIASAG